MKIKQHEYFINYRYVGDVSVVKNILKYLRRTKDMFLVYGGDKELVVNGYVDASFDTDPDDSKSQTGYVFTLNGGAVSWCSSTKRYGGIYV